jgi:hypothetical protein
MKQNTTLSVIVLFILALIALSACQIGTVNQPENWPVGSPTVIKLGDHSTISGPGAIFKRGALTITSGGTYNLNGTLAKGQIIVNTRDQGPVNLVMEGVNINNSTGAPLSILRAEKTILTLAEGTANFLSDGQGRLYEKALTEEDDAAIFCKSVLTITGDGSLTVNAANHHGITARQDLNIDGGNLTINSVNDGIRSWESLNIQGGIITVNAGADGLQTVNEQDRTEGKISIEGGTLNIVAGNDAIHAQTDIILGMCDVTISTAGGSHSVDTNSSDTNRNNWEVGARPDSAKGLKAEHDLIVAGATLDIDSADDAFNANGHLTVNSGTINISSGDDGLHADSSVEINGGDITVKKCYEGIESINVSINGGRIHLTSGDDGINVAARQDSPPSQNLGDPLKGLDLRINGGYVFVDAGGDGLDVNGGITMTGGTVIINGPFVENNTAVDFNGFFKMNGGFLTAAGSTGMAQAPGPSSTQNSIMVNLSYPQPAHTLFHIEDQNGIEILTFEPLRTYQSIVFSSPEIKSNSTYVVYTGGRSTGNVTDTVYSNGTYTPGSQYTSLTTSNMVTIFGPYGSHFSQGIPDLP